MAKRHFYIGIENVGLNASQKQTLVAELRKLGPKSDPQPARLNHWRTRLDGDAVIFEGLFDEDKLSVTGVKQYLANIFNVDTATINHSTQNSQYGPVVTFNRSGDKLRVILFGGPNATWEESRQTVLAYLKANAAQWEEAV